MKLKIQKNDILNQLNIVFPAINIKNTLPILTNILILVEKDSICSIATNIDKSIISNLKISEDLVEEAGSLLVPAKKFIDVIKALPNDVVKLSHSDNVLTVKCKKSTFKINCLSVEDFPSTPSFKNDFFVTMSCSSLKNSLEKVRCSISKDDARYILNAVSFIIENDSMELASADGKRLSVSNFKYNKISDNMKNKKFVIPEKTISELINILDNDGDVEVFMSENQILFKVGDINFISRLVEGDFPNYRSVIPAEYASKLKVNKNNLSEALKRISLFTDDKSPSVIFDIDKEKLTLSKDNNMIGEAREELDASYNGDKLTIRCNPRYIMDTIDNVKSDDISIEVIAKDKPMLVREGLDYVYFVLPIVQESA